MTVTSALAALAALVYAITQIPEIGWGHPRTLGMFLAALVLGGLFVVVENRSAAPLVPFRALRSRVLIGGNLLILTAGMAVDGMLITLTSFVQRELGRSALQFGVLAAVMTVTSVVAIVFAERSVTRFGVRRAAVSGGILLGVAGLLLAAAAVGISPLVVMIAGLLIFGAGMGAAFVSSQIAALTGVRDEHSGLASGLVESSFNIGAGLGVAIATTMALVGGYRAAFAATVAVAAVGVIVSVILFRRSTGTDAPARADLESGPASPPTES